MDLFQPLMYLASIVGYVVCPMFCGHGLMIALASAEGLSDQVLAFSIHRFSPVRATYQFGI